MSKEPENNEFMGFLMKGDWPEWQRKCIHCGKLVGAGIISLSSHWSDCEGKGAVEALTKAYEGGYLNESTVGPIISKVINENKNE